MDETTAIISLNVGHLWLLISACLVFFMQGGFLALEVGLSEKKHTINVGVKNLTDAGISLLLYWAIGFGLMYGLNESGFFGTNTFIPDVGQGSSQSAIDFFFQAAFCSTAVTILSGAVAGRMKFSSYLLVCVVVSGIIYPVFGSWVWNSGGWLAKRGFIDFAGSTVVHSVGGWVALAALLVIGARKGRFNKDGSVNDLAPSNMPLALIGVVILWFGWFGFNGGSVLAWFNETDAGLAMDSAVPGVVANTVLGGAAGLVAALGLSWYLTKHPQAGAVGNGALAGLVAVTANAHATSSINAIIIGAIGGVIAVLVEGLLLRVKIDDVVGALPVHLAAGIWGTLAFGIFAEPEYLAAEGGRMGQIVTQAIGIGAAGVWTFGLAFAALWLISKTVGLRVSEEMEELGLNTEHGFAPEAAPTPKFVPDMAGAMD